MFELRKHSSILLLGLSFLLVTAASLPLQAQSLEWVRQYGTVANDYAWGVATDSTGIYLTGFTNGTLPGEMNSGGKDAFICKYDAAGNQSWCRQFGSEADDFGRGVAVDITGVYIAGEIWGGALPGQTGRSYDAFVCKYDTAGNQSWCQQFGTPTYDGATAIATDGTGIYVAGYTRGAFTGQTYHGADDAFICKYDTAGNQSWCRQFGTSNSDGAHGIATSEIGIYVAGNTTGTLAGQTNSGGSDGFVCGYDFAGNQSWCWQFGTATPEYVASIAVDSFGGYVAGVTWGAFPGQSNSGSSDAFLCRFDAVGNPSWCRQFGTEDIEHDSGMGISVDSAEVFVAGTTRGTFSGQTKNGMYYDAYVCRYNAAGDQSWCRQYGSPNTTSGQAIASDRTAVYIAGAVQGAFPGQINVGLGFSDAFVAKLGKNPIAAAGPDQSVHPGDVATLDGSGSSDPAGNYPLTYAWSFASKPPGSGATLSGPATVNPSFTADAMGDYVLELVVTNSLGYASIPDTVQISTVNTPPVADAGPDQALIELFQTIALDGSQSYDDDGDPITFAWALTSKPSGSTAYLMDNDTTAPTLVPDVQGDYVIELVVSDPWAASEADSVTLSFTNVAPVADAGGNQAVDVLDTVFLDGSGSSDANFDPLTYGWSLVTKPEGSAALLSSPNAVATTFVADLPGIYIASLVVNDDQAASEPSNVTIVATLTPPVIIRVLQEAIYKINNEVDPGSLKNTSMAKAMTNKLIATIQKVAEGDYDGAIKKLEEDFLDKVNGCAESMQPDKNDWIQDCTEQAKVYPLIQQAIDLLRQL